MKKITFTVTSPKEGSLIALIKDVNKIPCRIHLDIQNRFVTAENINTSSISTVIELINKYYTLLGVDIDNCAENDDTVSTIENTTSVSSTSENSLPIKNVKVSTEKVSIKQDNKKECNGENALLETFSSAFDKLDSSKKVEEQIDSFLTDIRMITTDKMVKESFYTAYAIKKITYEKIIHELHNMHPNLTEPNIKAFLKQNFKKWLTQYPELAKQCPKLSFMTLLKTFSKKFA